MSKWLEFKLPKGSKIQRLQITHDAYGHEDLSWVDIVTTREVVYALNELTFMHELVSHHGNIPREWIGDTLIIVHRKQVKQFPREYPAIRFPRKALISLGKIDES